MTISYKKSFSLRLLFLLLMLSGLNTSVFAQVTATFYCSTGTNKTGSVNSAGTKNDGNMITINSSSNRGWASFDLSSIPPGSTVSAVTLKFTTYSSVSSSATNNVYGFTGDPVTMTGSALYTACASGTSFNASSWSANALQTKVLNATGIAFVAANVGGTLNIGFVRGSTNTYNIYGYPGTTAQQPQLDITYIPSTACSGTPSAGTTTGPASAICGSAGFSLGISGATVGQGISYQWESSPVGANTWTPITGATSSTYSQATATTAADYHCVVTCANSSLSAASTTLSITLNPFYNCYCTPASTCTNEGIINVTFNTLSNSSPKCNNTSGYSNFASLGSLTNVQQATNVPISVTGTINSNPASAGVWIDYNQNSVFDASEFTLIGSSTGITTLPANYTYSGNVYIPATALTGITRMRVRTANQGGITSASACTNSGVYGEYEDYLITIDPGTTCSGTPVGGTASGSAAVCPNVAFSMAATGFTTGLGVTYQWESSPAGQGTWTAITGATNTTYTAASGVAVNTDFRLVTTCTASGSSDVSTVYTMTLSPFYNCYCTPANGTTLYTSGTLYGDLISNVVINGTTLSNNSGTTNGTPSYVYFTGQPNYTADLQPATTYSLTVSIGSYASQGVAAWIDYNNDGIFDNNTERIGYSNGQIATAFGTATFPITLSCTPPPGIHRLRVRCAWIQNGINILPCATYGYGEAEEYDINIISAPSCIPGGALSAANPTPNSVDLSWALGCAGSTSTAWDFEYGPVGFTQGTGTLVSNVVATSSYTLTGLADTTTYQVYYRSNCGANGTSQWSTPVTFTTLAAPCSGTPATASITAPTGGCIGSNITLTATGTSFGPGLTYQWETLDAGGNWVAVANAVTTSLTTTITAATDFRFVTTCANGGGQSISNTVNIGINPFYNCYCASNATSTADEEILNVTFGTLNNSSVCNVAAPGAGSMASMYSNFTTIAPTTVFTGSTVPLSVQIGTCGGNYGNWTKVYIDFNQDGSFTGVGEEVYSSASYVSGPHFETGNILIPTTALTGVTGMRVVNVETTVATGVNPCGTYTWGETEDYLLNIQTPPSCSGAPNATTITGPSSVCSGSNFTLNATGFSQGLGITYQWESSPAGQNTWTAIANATNSFYNVVGFASATDFRFVTTCTTSSLQDVSNTVSVILSPYINCYCTPANGTTLYTYGTSSGDLISNVVINGTTLSNNSGTTAGTPSYVYFTGQPNYSADLQPATTYSLSVSIGSFSSQGVAAWIDYNDDGVFSSTERIGYSNGTIGTAFGTATFPISLACTPPAGIHRMRVRCAWITNGIDIQPCATYGWGETEEYDINIISAPSCIPGGALSAANPTPNSVDLSWALGCAASTATAWDFEYGPVGFTQGTGTLVSNVAAISSYTLTGLTDTTTYQVYYRSNCGGNGTSQWSLPVTFTTLSLPCSGTPATASVTAPTGTCASTNFTMTATGFSFGNGISYQWESYDATNAVWVPIVGANATSYSTAITAATSYRFVTTCATTSAQSISNTVSVAINPASLCYCASSATSTADEEIVNFTFGSLNNSSTCATVAPGAGSVNSLYSNYTNITPTTVNINNSIPFSINIGYCGSFAYSNIGAIYIDYNQNGSFSDPGEDVYVSSFGAGTYPAGRLLTGNITIPPTALTGVTGMRVIAVESSVVSPCGTYTWGETEDYLINIAPPLVVCPTPTVTITSSSPCPSGTVTFTANAVDAGLYPTYQWMINGSPVPNANLYLYSNIYSSSTLVAGDMVSVNVVSSCPNYTAGPVASNAITMNNSTSNTTTANASCSYTWSVNNTTYTTSGIYSVTNGCNTEILDLTILPTITPTVSVTPSTSTACQGSAVIFYATSPNLGTSNSYVWYVNNVAMPNSNNASYTSTTLNNGDVVKVALTTNATCLTTNTAMSADITMSITPVANPTVNITASANNVCIGTPITFTASETDGGTNPTYTWYVNNVVAPNANGSVFTTSGLSNGDVVAVDMVSNAACAAYTTATSNNITMSITPVANPTVNIAASANNVCPGTSITFTASGTDGGTNPTYTWYVNNVAVSNVTGSTYTSSNIANGDVVSVDMVSNAACAAYTTASSNDIEMFVISSGTPTVSITASNNYICPGQSVTLTSTTTYGGTAPTYQWYLNGSPIVGATNADYFALNGVNDGDDFYVEMTSNALCINSPYATSNTETIYVSTPTAGVTASGPLALCSGGNVTLTADQGNSYLWSNGATTQSITVSAAGSYTVSVTTVGGCVATSNPVNVIVKTMPALVKIKTVGLTTVCDPSTVLFMVDPNAVSLYGFDFQWNLNGTPITGATDTSYTASGASAGSVTLTVSGSSCTRTSAAKTYTIKPLPVATFTAGGPTTICAGGSVTLTAPTITGYTYTWFNNGVSAGSGASKVFKVAGVYTVQAKLNGCTANSTNSATIVVNPLPVAGITALTPATFCAGDSCTMQATPAGATTYAWINGTTTVTTSTNTYATMVAGTFKMMVTDGNGCVSKVTTASVKTKVNPIPVASISASTSTTIAANGSVKLNASPSTGVTFQWFLNGSPISGATTKTYIATAGGSYTVAITKTGCTGTSAATTVTQTGIKEEAGVTSNPTATEEAVFELAAYPNPVSGVLTINVRGIEEVSATVQVMDFNGRVVAMKEMTTTSTTVDMTGYASGMYLIRYKDAEGRTGTIKINKQ